MRGPRAKSPGAVLAPAPEPPWVPRTALDPYLSVVMARDAVTSPSPAPSSVQLNCPKPMDHVLCQRSLICHVAPSEDILP